LGDLANFEMGQAPPGAASNFSGMGEIFVKAGEFGSRHPFVREWTTKPLKYATDKDVLICVVGATAGKLNLGIDCAIGRSVAAIRPSVALDQLALYFQLLISVLSLRASSTGSAQGVISKKMLADIPIALAPLNEQRRIAAKLDTTLAAVEACRHRLDGVAVILKRFRQAVLAAATSGELTRETAVESPWKNVSIAEVCEVVRGASPRPAGDKRFFGGTGSIPWITVGELTKDGSKHLLSTSCFLTEEGKARSRYIYPGTLLLTNSGATLGVPKITLIGGCINDGSVALLGLEEPLKSYIYCVLLSMTQALRAINQGAAQPNLNTTIVKDIRFKIPVGTNEQTEVVTRIEELLALADQLEAKLTAARKFIERLTPALLAKAFRGELVPQDPSDEPACVLLERIRAARQVEAAAGKPSRRGRKKAAANPEPGPLPAALASPDFLAQLLQECGALSERALLAASELDPAGFRAQLDLEVGSGNIRAELEGGKQVLSVAREE
jgi:type I restriction enzyme S subunit